LNTWHLITDHASRITLHAIDRGAKALKAHAEKRTPWRPWSALLFCLLLSLACLTLALFPLGRSSAKSIPIALHSELSANYNADPPTTPFPQLQLSLIQDVIRNEASAAEAPERLSTVENNLKTLVPTITPVSTPATFITPQPQPSLIAPSPTSTRGTPTATLSTPTPTLATPTRKPTKQPKPTHNPPPITSTPKNKKKPTPTAVPPLITFLPQLPTATPTWTPQDSATPEKKTKTPKPTATPMPTLPIPTLPIIILPQDLSGLL
jgi:hypothetical protein